MKGKLYLKNLLLLLLLLRAGTLLQAQTIDVNKSVSNITTGGNGTSGSQNNILEYTIIVKNLAGINLTTATLFDNIPAGVSYVAGSTTLNALPVADIPAGMPFTGTGGLINSPGSLAGILAPNIAATIKFRVKVTANGGNITNYATLQCNYNSTGVVQNSNTVFTNLSPDPTCSQIYQSTTSTSSGTPQGSPSRRYQYIKLLNTTNGTAGPVIYDGAVGLCFNAITGASMTAGSIMSYTSAIGYDKNSNRIYFVNNSTTTAHNLCYIDLNATPVCAREFVGYPLETTTGTGWNINRMSFASDGFGYAITESGTDLIRFSINTVTGLPVINRLGALINASSNGANDILSEKGGDIFGDGSGNLYLVANSSNLYKINPNNRIATFLGSVNPFPGSSNSIAVDAAGNVFIGGAYQNVYTVNLATMNGGSITGGNTTNVWTNGDYTSCAFPVLAPALVANKTYRNTNGKPFVVGGDTVEYVIEVTNTGNINAAGVKLFDAIPASTNYIPNSTKLNGVTVPDVTGLMPFSLAGGRFIFSVGEQNGIIKPGTANKAVLTFRAKTSPLNMVCNQSRITLLDANGNTIFINSNDPTQPGSQNATCFYTDGVLPANALQFKGYVSNDQSVLQWAVTDEWNVQQYEVEYSTDGIHFTRAGIVPGRGNHTGITNYQLADGHNTLSTLRYYRLKMVSTRGFHSYSSIIKLSLKNLHVLQVQPNPFEQEITVQLQLKNSAQIVIRLIDLHGRVVMQTNNKLNTGVQSLPIRVPATLGKGIYVLELLSDNESTYREKLLKK